MTQKTIRVVGGGLAGSEAAYRLATRGFQVELFEMRPVRGTEAHKTDGLAELVCSNSFKSLSLATAPGILKAEMDVLGSLALLAARRAAVAAGEALAVDRDVFSHFITEMLSSHPNIRIRREEFSKLDPQDGIPTIVATGPLTSPALSAELQRLTGAEEFYFYDAISPILSLSAIDFTKAFRANRHDKVSRTLAPSTDMQSALGSANETPAATATENQTDSDTDPASAAPKTDSNQGDYINCPMTRGEYEAFVDALLKAERVETKHFERVKHFEGCMPIEEMADRGRDTLRFGPMRPIGIIDPRTGRRPWAVVQLRPENREATMYNMVGFQTKMKYGEQKRVLQMIPGLENAEFLRFGSMHRNAFVNAPAVLAENLALKAAPNIFLAGQITGVEGYMESAATGILAAIFVEAFLDARPAPLPPRATALGSLLSHLRNLDSPDFQPMGINFGLFDETAFAEALAPLVEKNRRAKKLPKHEKREAIGAAAVANAITFASALTAGSEMIPDAETTGARKQPTLH